MNRFFYKNSFDKNPYLKRVKNKNYQGFMLRLHMQMDLRIPLTKVFFLSNQHDTFSPFFKYHIVFPDQPEDCIGEDDIIDIVEVIILQFMSLQYVILCSKEFITENIVKTAFLLPSTFLSSRKLSLRPKVHFDKNKRII